MVCVAQFFQIIGYRGCSAIWRVETGTHICFVVCNMIAVWAVKLHPALMCDTVIVIYTIFIAD